MTIHALQPEQFAAIGPWAAEFVASDGLDPTIGEVHWGVVDPGGTLIIDHNGSALKVTAKFGS
jgi:hypothetical protein